MPDASDARSLYLVIDENPLIVADLCGAIEEAAPDAVLLTAGDVDEGLKIMEGVDVLSAVFVGLSSAAVAATALPEAADQRGAALVTNGDLGDEIEGSRQAGYVLPRPFSTEMVHACLNLITTGGRIGRPSGPS